MKQSTVAIILLWFMLFCYQAGITQRKPHKLSSEEVRQIMQTDIIRLRDQVEADRGLFVREHENRMVVEAQLSNLKAQLFKLSR